LIPDVKFNLKPETSRRADINRNKYRGDRGYPFKAGFSPKPKQVFRYKAEKILGSLYLTRPSLGRMQVKAIIDNIIPESKEKGQIVTTGEVSEVLVADCLHHPRPLYCTQPSLSFI